MKITIEIDETRERQLQCLAEMQKQDMAEIIQRVVEEYLDDYTIPDDTDEELAEIAMYALQESLRDEPPWEETEPDGP